ncbi:MAG TPA: hypothetical protein EYP81_04540 [Thermodesulfobacteriaceae bacterium]|nr:hypothetical protein [Thermodesulfobacteriaceae bacterium]
METKDKGLLDLLFTIEGLFILIILAFRLAYIREVPLQLSPDEAYYWDWSRNLAWGYYSKPPMVAWLIAASTHFLGVSEYAVRLPAVFCGIGFLIFVYLLTYRMFERLCARWTLFAAALVPIFTVYGLLMTIDPPLLFFWAGALYFGWLAAEKDRFRDWFLLGIFCGLGLLTKQTMLAFGFFYGLWLLCYRRSLLRTPGPWLAFLTAFLLWGPNLYWIAHHDFITFRHTEHHFAEETFSLLGPLNFFLEQAGVLSPFIFGLFLWGAVMLFKRRNWRSDPRLTYLWALSAWPYLAVLPLSFFRKVNANWPMPFFVSGLVLTTVLIFSLKGRPLVKVLRGLFFLGLILAFTSSLLLYELPRFPEKFPTAISGLLFRFHGWREMAHIVQKYRRPGDIILTDHRYFASELAFYLPDHPRVYQLPEGPIPKSQYHLWGIPGNLRGKPALFVMKGRHSPSSEAYLILFQKIKLPGNKQFSFSVWRGYFK